MAYLIVGFVCLMIGAVAGMVLTSLMTAAANEDRCRDCIMEHREKNKENK